MHPMFKELFIDAGADDPAAGDGRRRRGRRSRRARPAVILRPAAGRRETRPGRDRLSARRLTLEIPRTGWCTMPTATQIAVTQPDLTGARCPALFCSGLQPSDAPDAGTVAAAISRTVRQFGADGCAGRMAQEFGDHPDAAASRMRWVRQLIPPGPPARRQAAA
jgi:hypothetical protein